MERDMFLSPAKLLEFVSKAVDEVLTRPGFWALDRSNSGLVVEQQCDLLQTGNGTDTAPVLLIDVYDSASRHSVSGHTDLI